VLNRLAQSLICSLSNYDSNDKQSC